MELDLNIENYELQDILKLFKIPYDFTEEDLRNAKKIVLKTHPDKSKLSPDYFRFFTKAYKKLYSIWEFKNKDTKARESNATANANTIYSENVLETFSDKEKKKVLDTFVNKNKLNDANKFNDWFNKEFEKNRLLNEEDEHGYGDWLKSNEDIEEEQVLSLSQMNDVIEKKKRQLRDRDLIVHKDVNELHFQTNASNIVGEIPAEYSSDMFGSLKYEDLHKAHTETIIPVTMDDYKNVKKFKNVNEYNAYRNTQDTTPLSELQAHQYLRNKEKLEETQSTQRAYKLAKQIEDAEKKQQTFWGNMMNITM
jgi:hypothetical protein